MKINDGVFRQRVGSLIETHICETFNLRFNQRQKTVGYYDAYNAKDIYEIKASSKSYNTFIIKQSNHEQLLKKQGKYIFISYNLINRDKNLSVITDIDILNIYIINANNLDPVLMEYGRSYEKRKHLMYKIQLVNVLKANDIERGVNND